MQSYPRRRATPRRTYEVPERFKRDACRSCKATIYWLQPSAAAAREGARPIPLDVASATRDVFGTLLMESHFHHCPDAERWRRRRRRAG